jgi:hypothetical protein
MWTDSLPRNATSLRKNPWLKGPRLFTTSAGDQPRLPERSPMHESRRVPPRRLSPPAGDWPCADG